MDIISELNSLKADYLAAQTLLDEAKQANDSLSTALATSDQSVKERLAELADFKIALSAKETELGKLQGELAELKATQKTAEAKAVEIVANVGIKPMAAHYSAEKSVKDRAEVIETIHALKDPIARAQFYFANKAVLFPA